MNHLVVLNDLGTTKLLVRCSTKPNLSLQTTNLRTEARRYSKEDAETVASLLNFLGYNAQAFCDNQQGQ